MSPKINAQNITGRGAVCETRSTIADKLAPKSRRNMRKRCHTGLCSAYTTTLSIWKVKKNWKYFYKYCFKSSYLETWRRSRLKDWPPTRDAWPICKVRTYQTETSQKIWPLPQEKNTDCAFCLANLPTPPFLPWKICLWSNRWAFDCLELWRWVLAVEKVQVRPPSASAGPQAFRLRGQA